MTTNQTSEAWSGAIGAGARGARSGGRQATVREPQDAAVAPVSRAAGRRPREAKADHAEKTLHHPDTTKSKTSGARKEFNKC
jgi:hypothetical protein